MRPDAETQEAIAETRTELELLGSAVQFFVACCLYLAQHPEDVPGQHTEWRDKDASFSAAMMGATLHLLGQAWRGLDWTRDRVQVRRWNGEVDLEVRFPSGV